MKKIFVSLLILAACFFSASALAGNAPPPQFFVGAYRIVGVDPATQEPFQGFCEIKLKGGKLEMRRFINEVWTRARLDFDSVTGDNIPILVAKFTQNGKDYVVSYDIGGDAGNYAILTGWSWIEGERRTEAGGRESLTAIHGDLRRRLLAELEAIGEDHEDAPALKKLIEAIPEDAKDN